MVARRRTSSRSSTRPSSRTRYGLNFESSGRRGDVIGSATSSRGRSTSAASRCGRGSRPSTARRWRTGSRSGSARRSGASGSPRRCSAPAPILGTLAEVARDGKVDVAGVVDDTQVDGVLYQWQLNGNASWKMPALRRFLEDGRLRRQAVHDVGARTRCTTSCTRRSRSPTTSSFIGSFNLSHSGEMNAENVLEIEDAAIADRLAAFVDEIRALYPLGHACRRTRLRDRWRHLRFCDENRIALAAPFAVALVAVGAAQALRLPGAPALPGLPGVEPVEPARRQAARRGGLGPRRRGDRRSTTACTPTSARGSGTAGRSASRSRSSARRQPRSRVALRVRGRERQGPVPDPAERRDRGRPRVRRRPPRADRRPRRCKLYELFALYPTAGGGWKAGSGAIWTCARTSCGRPAGRRPTRPACRSSPGSRATTRSRAGGSTTRSASPSSARAAPTSGRRATTRATSTDPEPAADGPALPPEGELRHRRLPAAGADRAPGAEGATG